jgi:dTDP-4-amino-4,6-dideoxy-D-galactose acyltransferase
MNLFELLDWDSAFFGFPVGRVSSQVADAVTLRDALQALRARNVRLAYWFAEPGAHCAQLAQTLQAVPVGERILFRRRLAPRPPAPTGLAVARHAGGEVPPALEALAVQAGALSRFAIDPAMPAGTAARMYRVWIERSVSGAIADAVYLARSAEGALAGMITTARQDACGVIGLLAVDPGFRGAGVGHSLTDAAHRHFLERGLREAQVVTQAANAAACRLYARSGYVAALRQAAYHFWL